MLMDTIDMMKRQGRSVFVVLFILSILSMNAMAEPKITVDLSQIKDFPEDFQRRVIIRGFEDLLDHGVDLLAEEAPKKTGQLRLGMTRGNTDYSALRGELVAHAERGGTFDRSITVSLKGGKTKQVTLRGQPAFDYAQAVAEGTGIYGPRHTPIVPKSGKVLLIPQNDNFPIFRRSAKGQKPNPYHERAAAKLEAEAAQRFEAVVASFAELEKAG